MNLPHLAKSIATVGPLGYLNGSGTVGSIVGMLLVLLINRYISSLIVQILTIIILCIIAYKIINFTLQLSRQLSKLSNFTDPSEIIIDEVIGCLVTFIAVPISINTVMLGFLIFRFFDITKIFGLSYLESLKGAFGVLADDIGAGLIANCFLQLFLNS